MAKKKPNKKTGAVNAKKKKVSAKGASRKDATPARATQSDWSARKDVFVHPAATVIGLVEMGPDCSIWPGAVLRADMNYIRLGRCVNIQDNSTMHVDTRGGASIGDYSLIGHNTMLHSCHIGRGVMIGIGSVILDGADIGDGAMITAGCLIRGGKRIPPGAMVIQKDGQLRVIEGAAKTRLTISGALEYRALAERHRRGEWGPFSSDEESAFLEEADRILKGWGPLRPARPSGN